MTGSSRSRRASCRTSISGSCSRSDRLHAANRRRPAPRRARRRPLRPTRPNAGSTERRRGAMNAVNRRALLGLVNLLVAIGGALFACAWSLAWWQAWAFLGVFFGCVLAITLYLMKRDPKLLERRVQ